MLPAGISELKQIKKECRRMATKRSFLSAAASVVPVSFADITTDVVLLKKIIPGINEKFGLASEQIKGYSPQVAILIYDVTKEVGTHLIGKYVTKELITATLKKIGFRLTTREVAKFVPTVGQALSAGISFAVMRFVIYSHINKCYRVVKTLIKSGVPAVSTK